MLGLKREHVRFHRREDFLIGHSNSQNDVVDLFVRVLVLSNQLVTNRLLLFLRLRGHACDNFGNNREVDGVHGSDTGDQRIEVGAKRHNFIHVLRDISVVRPNVIVVGSERFARFLERSQLRVVASLVIIRSLEGLNRIVCNDRIDLRNHLSLTSSGFNELIRNRLNRSIQLNFTIGVIADRLEDVVVSELGNQLCNRIVDILQTSLSFIREERFKISRVIDRVIVTGVRRVQERVIRLIEGIDLFDDIFRNQIGDRNDRTSSLVSDGVLFADNDRFREASDSCRIVDRLDVSIPFGQIGRIRRQIFIEYLEPGVDSRSNLSDVFIRLVFFGKSSVGGQLNRNVGNSVVDQLLAFDLSVRSLQFVRQVVVSQRRIFYKRFVCADAGFTGCIFSNEVRKRLSQLNTGSDIRLHPVFHAGSIVVDRRYGYLAVHNRNRTVQFLIIRIDVYINFCKIFIRNRLRADRLINRGEISFQRSGLFKGLGTGKQICSKFLRVLNGSDIIRQQFIDNLLRQNLSQLVGFQIVYTKYSIRISRVFFFHSSQGSKIGIRNNLSNIIAVDIDQVLNTSRDIFLGKFAQSSFFCSIARSKRFINRFRFRGNLFAFARLDCRRVSIERVSNHSVEIFLSRSVIHVVVRVDRDSVGVVCRRIVGRNLIGDQLNISGMRVHGNRTGHRIDRCRRSIGNNIRNDFVSLLRRSDIGSDQRRRSVFRSDINVFVDFSIIRRPACNDGLNIRVSRSDVGVRKSRVDRIDILREIDHVQSGKDIFNRLVSRRQRVYKRCAIHIELTGFAAEIFFHNHHIDEVGRRLISGHIVGNHLGVIAGNSRSKVTRRNRGRLDRLVSLADARSFFVFYHGSNPVNINLVRSDLFGLIVCQIPHCAVGVDIFRDSKRVFCRIQILLFQIDVFRIICSVFCNRRGNSITERFKRSCLVSAVHRSSNHFVIERPESNCLRGFDLNLFPSSGRLILNLCTIQRLNERIVRRIRNFVLIAVIHLCNFRFGELRNEFVRIFFRMEQIDNVLRLGAGLCLIFRNVHFTLQIELIVFQRFVSVGYFGQSIFSLFQELVDHNEFVIQRNTADYQRSRGNSGSFALSRLAVASNVNRFDLSDQRIDDMNHVVSARRDGFLYRLIENGNGRLAVFHHNFNGSGLEELFRLIAQLVILLIERSNGILVGRNDTSRFSLRVERIQRIDEIFHRDIVFDDLFAIFGVIFQNLIDICLGVRENDLDKRDFALSRGRFLDSGDIRQVTQLNQFGSNRILINDDDLRSGIRFIGIEIENLFAFEIFRSDRGDSGVKLLLRCGSINRAEINRMMALFKQFRHQFDLRIDLLGIQRVPFAVLIELRFEIGNSLLQGIDIRLRLSHLLIQRGDAVFHAVDRGIDSLDLRFDFFGQLFIQIIDRSLQSGLRFRDRFFKRGDGSLDLCRIRLFRDIGCNLIELIDQTVDIFHTEVGNRGLQSSLQTIDIGLQFRLGGRDAFGNLLLQLRFRRSDCVGDRIRIFYADDDVIRRIVVADFRTGHTSFHTGYFFAACRGYCRVINGDTDVSNRDPLCDIEQIGLFSDINANYRGTGDLRRVVFASQHKGHREAQSYRQYQCQQLVSH